MILLIHRAQNSPAHSIKTVIPLLGFSHAFTLALDGGKWSVSHSRPLYIHKLEKEGWLSPRAGLDAAIRKHSSLTKKRTHSSVIKPVVYSVNQQSIQSAPPESLKMIWQKWCPHGLSYLISPTANPTGIMGPFT